MRQFMLFFFFLPLSLIGQFSTPEWDDVYDKGLAFNDIIEATNGNVVAVGESKNIPNSKQNGLLVMRDFSTGTELTRKYYGGGENDQFQKVIQTFDGYFYMAGMSEDKRGQGKKDGWIVKIDEKGNKVLDQFFGGSEDDVFSEIVLLNDGSIVVAGMKDKNSLVWIMRLKEENGQLTTVWEKTLNGEQYESIEGMVLMQEEYLVLTGNTPRSKRYGGGNAWILQLNENGGEIWGPTYIGEEGVEQVRDIIVTDNGALALAGLTTSIGDGKIDMWFQRVTGSGTKLGFPKSFGGRDDDMASAFTQRSDGSFLLVGKTLSHKRGARKFKAYLVQTNANGVASAAEPYGGSNDDEARAVLELHNGSIVMVGTTSSKSGGPKAWMVKYPAPIPTFAMGGRSGASPSFKIENTEVWLNKAEGVLKPEERSYISFKLTNNEGLDFDNVRIEVSHKTGAKNLAFWKNNYIGKLAANESKSINIPVFTGNNVEDADNELEFTVYSGAKALKQFKDKVITKNPRPATLAITGKFPEYEGADRMSPKTITLKVINNGDAPSRNVVVRFDPPRGILALSNTTVQVGDMAPKASKNVRFRFQPTAQLRQTESYVVIDYQVFSAERTHVKESMQFSLDRAVSGNSNEFFAFQFPNPAEMDNGRMEWGKPDIDIQGYIQSKHSGIQSKDMVSYINGIQVDRSKFEEERIGTPKKMLESSYFNYKYEKTFKLQEGENRIVIQARTPNGVIRSNEMIINYRPNRPDLHILAIGPSHEDLKFTGKDAQDFAKAYSNQEGATRAFGNVYVNALTQKDNTGFLDINRALKELENRFSNYGQGVYEDEISNDDILIVFISSHGKSDNKQFKILPSDYAQYGDVANIDYQDHILGALNRINCKKMVFIDACHSGSAGQKKLLGSARKALEQINQLYPGLNVLTSSQPDELSYEDEAWQNGAFTEAILEAFSGQSFVDGGGSYQADANDDKIITFGELYSFLQRRVPSLVSDKKPGQRQMPAKTVNDLTDDMPIYVLY